MGIDLVFTRVGNTPEALARSMWKKRVPLKGYLNKPIQPRLCMVGMYPMSNHPTVPHDPDVVRQLQKIATTEASMKRTSYPEQNLRAVVHEAVPYVTEARRILVSQVKPNTIQIHEV